MVISVGRFHPLVFAACSKTPAVFCEWGLTQSGNPENFAITPKANRICQETGIGYFDNPASLGNALSRSETILEPRGFDDSYFERFDAMKMAVTNRFLDAAKTSQG